MDVIAIAVLMLLAVIVTGIVVFYFQSRQAGALRGMLKVEERRLAFLIKSHRDQLAKDVEIIDGLKWLSELLSSEIGTDTNVDQVAVKLTAPFALDLLASKGRHVVVSPLDPRRLKKALGRVVKRGNGNGYSEHAAVLASIKRSKSYRVALVDPETSLVFDIEAQAVGKKLGLDWGQPEELWFMVG